MSGKQAGVVDHSLFEQRVRDKIRAFGTVGFKGDTESVNHGELMRRYVCGKRPVEQERDTEAFGRFYQLDGAITRVHRKEGAGKDKRIGLAGDGYIRKQIVMRYGVGLGSVRVFTVKQLEQLQTGMGDDRGETRYGLGGKAAKRDDHRRTRPLSQFCGGIGHIGGGAVVYRVEKYGFNIHILKECDKPVNQMTLYEALFRYDKHPIAIGFADSSNAVKHISSYDDFWLYSE
jgi:hypothetical protein